MTNQHENNSAQLSFEETQTLLETQLDGDILSSEEAAKLQQSLPFYPALQAYGQAASDVLTGLKEMKATVPLGSDFTDKVMSKIEVEKTPDVTSSVVPIQKSFWNKPAYQITGIAVALAVILLVPAMNPFVNKTSVERPSMVSQHVPDNVEEKGSAGLPRVENKSVAAQSVKIQPAALKTEEEVLVAQITGVTNELVPENDLWENTEDPMVMMLGF